MIRTIILWFPIWLVSLGCLLVGVANGIHFATAPPSETRPEEWQRYYAQVDWYLAGLLAFWGQLLAWCIASRPRMRTYIIFPSLVAILISGFLFLAVASAHITDAMIP